MILCVHIHMQWNIIQPLNDQDLAICHNTDTPRKYCSRCNKPDRKKILYEFTQYFVESKKNQIYEYGEQRHCHG
jgi:hypothetical protein